MTFPIQEHVTIIFEIFFWRTGKPTLFAHKNEYIIYNIQVLHLAKSPGNLTKICLNVVNDKE